MESKRYEVPSWIIYSIYNIVSGSMESEIPVRSVIYVESVDPENIQPKDIIAHRVVENQVVEEKFITKGDANAEKDMQPVDYSELVGWVAAQYPQLGGLMVLYTSNIEKAYVICFAACGVMFNLLAGKIRGQRK